MNYFQFNEFFFQILILLALISQNLCQTTVASSTTDTTDIYNTESTTIYYDLEPLPFPPGRALQEKTVSFLDYNSQEDNDCSAFFDLTRFEIVTPKGQLK